MKIEVKRITPDNLFRECAEMTTGKECKMSWNRALCSGHSIIRAEQYLIKMYDIPLCVASHLVRHVHSQPYQRSKRPDRGGDDMETECGFIASNIAFTKDRVMCVQERDGKLDEGAINRITMLECEEANIRQLSNRFGRHAPTDMALLVNAEEIINISKVRPCSKASQETRDVWKAVITEIAKIDPELALHCVPMCMYRGGICPEPKSCGYNKSEMFKKHLESYKKLFQQ